MCSYSSSPISTIEIIIPVKIWFGQHIIGGPFLSRTPIFTVVLFQRFTYILKCNLTDAKANRDPDSGLRVIADFHGPAADIADVANASTTADGKTRTRHGTARVHFAEIAI